MAYAQQRTSRKIFFISNSVNCLAPSEAWTTCSSKGWTVLRITICKAYGNLIRKQTFANQHVCLSICHYLGLNWQMQLRLYLYNKDNISQKKGFQHDNSNLLPFNGQFYHFTLCIMENVLNVNLMQPFFWGKMLLWMITNTKSNPLLDISTHLNVPKNKICHCTINNVYRFEIWNFQYDTLVNLLAIICRHVWSLI